MFFVLSKVLGFFAQPSNLLAVIGLVGALLLMTRRARLGQRLLVICVMLLFAFGFLPIGNALILPLEQRFPPRDASRGPPAGIVVLGGAINLAISVRRGEPALADGAARITAAVELARRYPAARVVFTGATAELVPSDATEAKYAKLLFTRLGIPPEQIELEDRSRNTAENAVFTKALVKPKPSERWLLVTSASHMPRAIGTFRQAGFPIDAYPVDWRTRGPIDLVTPFLSVWVGLRTTEFAVHEWIGLLAYRLTGRIPELLPGPDPRGECDKSITAEGCRR
jgi:uncharacterized SAM-binding protein YcdF (DUF218 family)